jgi:thermitase
VRLVLLFLGSFARSEAKKGVRRVLPLLSLAILILSSTNGYSAASLPFVPGRLLVKPKASVTESNFLSRIRTRGFTSRRTLRNQNINLLSISEDRAEAALAALKNDPAVEFAERDVIARSAFVPNDPEVVSGAEWHLQKIQAPAAWDYTFGSSQVIVAILDSGINAAHPDLIGHVIPGYNFVSGNSDFADDFGHGTAVAGTIFAAGNNGVGVAGVAFGSTLLPVKVVDSSGFATYSDIANGIYFAVEQGAKVINISIAGDSASPTLQSAVDFAWSNNVVIVAAAGNNANSIPQYPAACDHVVAVSATTAADSLADFSSFGSYVSLSAPGDDIWTTQRDLSNPYGPWRGTSFASPIVAGVAALALAANPSLSSTQLVSLLINNTDDLGAAGYDFSFGQGRVNALKCLAAAYQSAGDLPPATNTPPAAIESTAVTNVSVFPLTGLNKYSGLVADTNGVTTQSSGYFTIAVRKTGAFSGRISLAGKRYGIHGQFDTNGEVTLEIPRRLNSSLTLALRIDAATTADHVSGTLTDSTNHWNAQVASDRNVFNARLNPAPQAGVRGFMLERADDAASAASGAGRIAKNGGTRLRGKLVDGRPFSAGSTVAKNGDYPFYLSLHHGDETVIGWISFSTGQPETAGTVIWISNEATNNFARKLIAAAAPLP